jgi:Na+-transporting NADH:ubiquinone oxidoreductase subunit D
MSAGLPKKSRDVFLNGLWDENPVFRQILGICSTLAVTNLMFNTLIMCVGLTFATAMSCLTVSILRQYTPKRVRMMAQVLIIAGFVILVDIVIKWQLPEISKQLGPYVALIITNCIIMGRCEGFAAQNKPLPSFVDGVGMGVGYSLVLMAIAAVREIMGSGTIFKGIEAYIPALGGQPITVLGDWWQPWVIMMTPPAGFFMLAIVIWVCRSIPGRPRTT